MTWRVFYSYSHKDSVLRDKLAAFLAPLRQNNKIADWHDRKIQPGANWQNEISQHLWEANLIVFLISPDFLNSAYCLGVEVEAALGQLKRGAAMVIPVLIRECLWEESIFSQLQMIPRDAKPILSQYWSTSDEALKEVANEIRNVVGASAPAPESSAGPLNAAQDKTGFDLVRQQVRSYARLYDGTRLRMRSSKERTDRMEEIASHLRSLAMASYPLLDEFLQSPFPGERLGAVTILQVFAAEKYLGFLARLVGSEKPFIGYHAIRALRFAVDSLEPDSYALLRDALNTAQEHLEHASVGFNTDRQTLLTEAIAQLEKNAAAVPAALEKHD